MPGQKYHKLLVMTTQNVNTVTKASGLMVGDFTPEGLTVRALAEARGIQPLPDQVVTPRDVRNHHAREKKQPKDDALVLGRDVLDGEDLVKRPDRDDREEHPNRRTSPAEDRDTAEEHDRDDVEFQTARRVVTRGIRLVGVENARERTHHARGQIEQKFDALHADAREERCLLLQSDRENRPTEGREVKQDAIDHREHHKNTEGPCEGRAWNRVRADVRPRTTEVGDLVRPEYYLGEPAEHRECPNGHRDGR